MEQFKENQNNNNKKAELTGEQHSMLVAMVCVLREAGVERERDCRNSAQEAKMFVSTRFLCYL